MDSSSSKKGNDPQRWDKLLSVLDEKLQLGLLDYLRRISSYHFEEDILYLEPANEQDYEYLTKDTVHQQIELLAQDAINVEQVKIKND